MPRCQKNPRPPDATQGEPGLEPPNEPRQDQDRLEIRPPGRASQIRLQKELFHPVRALDADLGPAWVHFTGSGVKRQVSAWELGVMSKPHVPNRSVRRRAFRLPFLKSARKIRSEERRVGKEC